MPKYLLGAWDQNNVLSAVDVIEKKEKKTSGQNKNPVGGFYAPSKKPDAQLFIKVEVNKAKEFAELWTGMFIGGVITQPGLQQYQRNFGIPRPGMIKDLENPSNPNQIAIVQDRLQAAPLAPKRHQLYEKVHPIETKRKGAELNQDQFAATLVMSIFAHDYSVHLGNFMRGTEEEDLAVRIDFGSAGKGLLEPGHETNVFTSPEGTKWYKDYVDDWTGNADRRADIAWFVREHEADLNPQVIAQKAVDACEQLFNTVYANAPVEDIRAIYRHLHGKNHEFLYAYSDVEINEFIQKDRTELESVEADLVKAQKGKVKASQAKVDGLKARQEALYQSLENKHKHMFERSKKTDAEIAVLLKKEIIQDVRIGMEKRAENLIKEAKTLDKRPLKEQISSLDNQIKTEKEFQEQYEMIGNMAHQSIINSAESNEIHGSAYSAPADKISVKLSGDPATYLTRQSVEIQLLEERQLGKKGNIIKKLALEELKDAFISLESAYEGHAKCSNQQRLLMGRKKILEGELQIENQIKAMGPKPQSTLGKMGSSARNIFGSGSSSSSSSSSIPAQLVNINTVQNATGASTPSPLTAVGVVLKQESTVHNHMDNKQ